MKKIKVLLLSGACALGLLTAQGRLSQAAGDECPATENGRYICGLGIPEDLFAVPETPWIIVSSGGQPGSLMAIDSARNIAMTLAFAAPVDGVIADGAYKNCPAPLQPEQFVPHGLNMRIAKNGRHTLYVVNHGGRESVEIFSVNVGSEGPAVSWRGCVVAPAQSYLNAVVPLPEGGFAVTSFMDPTDPRFKEKLLAGGATGRILEWRTQRGWQAVPGSELSGNNGIELSPDGRWYYVAGWAERSFVRLSRQQEPVRKQTVAVNFLPDNIRWSGDGRLLLAGHGGTTKTFFRCMETGESCLMPSTIIAIDPETLKTQTLLSLPGDENFNTASVAVQVNGELFLGNIRVPRVAAFPLAAGP